MDDTRELRRALTQQLEGLQRAGLSYVPKVAAPVAPVVTFAAPATEMTRPAETVAAVSAPPAHATVSVESRTLFSEEPAIARKQTAAASVAVSAPSTLSLADRQQKLAALSRAVAACRRCAELCSTRTQTVFGVGSPQAKILFIGEAPGADEDKQGVPFVGRAGQLLDKIIEACRLKRDDVYICNILKCRPPGNRNPSPAEAANCREFLLGQIEAVDPEYIVCWGSVAAQNLLESTAPIGKMRGQFHRYGRAKVLCTYHPSYLLRNPAAKKDVWEDMKFLMSDMGVAL